MYENLLDFIACPICNRPFELKVDKRENKHIMEGELKCPKDHVSYQIYRGIPRFAGDLEDDHTQVKESFRSKWAIQPELYSTSASHFAQDFYFERYNWYDAEDFDSFVKDKEFILDVGAGVGRILSKHLYKTKGQIISFELSDSVDFIFQNHKNNKNVHIIQADIFKLPISRSVKFDYIIANAVLHHTRSTRLALKEIASFLREDGVIDTYIYRKKSPIREMADTYLIEHTSAMTEEECWEFSRSITNLGKELSKYKEDIVIEKEIPLLGIKKGKYNLQRFIFYNILKCFWNSEVGYDFSLLVNYDWYRPKYSHRHTLEEIMEWCSDFGLKIKELNDITSGYALQLGKST